MLRDNVLLIDWRFCGLAGQLHYKLASEAEENMQGVPRTGCTLIYDDWREIYILRMDCPWFEGTIDFM